MNLQVLVSAMNQEPRKLIENMKLSSDAIIINQCDRNAYEEIEGKNCLIKVYSFWEKGVGLSRNNALLRANHTISLFADEDIVYHKGYEEKVIAEFVKHPKADMIIFNFEVKEERRTYYNKKWKRVHLYNCGRYPTFSFAVRTERIHQKNITYSLLFGGGARYSNGEDSLFISECIKKGLQVYASPIELGKEVGRPSTWFNGYTEKFFKDRGVLYRHLYGLLAVVFAIRFLLKNKKTMCGVIPVKRAFYLMRLGIKEA